jgi:hypothetical protein
MRSVKQRGQLAVVLAAFACGCARAPALRHDLLGAELHFLSRYAASLSGACKARDLDLTLTNRPPYVIDTLPAIAESSWRLRACGYDLAFTLDCARWPAGTRCRAHEWPSPGGEGDAALEGTLERELAAAAGVAPPCRVDRSCIGTRTCGEDGLTLRRLAQDADESRFEVGRCGETRTVVVRCDLAARSCGARVVDQRPARLRSSITD